MKFPRSSGVLLPIFSLPSPFGIGDIGEGAYKFIDWLKTANQTMWQMLPFAPADQSGCPYSGFSAFGGYPLLISPEKLVESGLLQSDEIISTEGLFSDRVNYPKVEEYKTTLFKKAFERFKKDKSLIKECRTFIKKERSWVIDLSVFLVLTEQFGAHWTTWPESLKRNKRESVAKFYKKNEDQIVYHQFLQFIFFKQWREFKNYANKNGVKLIGDIPIFLSHHSMDVWKNSHYYKLDDFGEPYVQTGAPPDEFSVVGQKWGNPNYNWQEMEQDGFLWWRKRVSFMLEHFDIIRLDHFRGFAATWEIPAGNSDARSGQWSQVPGDNLFHCINHFLGDLPLIVEDLGKITDDVLKLRDKYNFPGMKILQFAFGKGDENKNLPHNFGEHCVVYTGTHDNETAKGYFCNMPDTLEKHYMRNYTSAWNTDELNWSLISLALNSAADLAITPLQDVMGLYNEARINTPGTSEHNWKWRFNFDDINSFHQYHLGELTHKTGRCN